MTHNSLAHINFSNPAEFLEWFETHWAPNSTEEEKTTLTTCYPNNLADGSPFGTGDLNRLAPQFKRVAALQGDLVFQAPRRFFTQQLSEAGREDVWVYCKLFFVLPLPLH
jgi:acetylcholinesterase